MLTPFYDPLKSYEENFKDGPFGVFKDGKIYEQKSAPKYEFLGHRLHLPFGIPAGPLINGNFVTSAFQKGFDIAVYKTVRSAKYPCHAWPNVLAVHIDGDLTLEKAKEPLIADTHYTEPISITNSFGVPSYPPEFWQEDMRRAMTSSGEGQMMIASFQGTNTGEGFNAFLQDHVYAARLVKETGVPAMIVNLSCPNEGSEELLCFDVDRVEQIARAIKDAVGETPLLLKLSHFESTPLLKKLVERLGKIVQGFVSVNTIPAKVLNREGEQALPGKGRLRSGICGNAIQWAGLDMVRKLTSLRRELDMSYVVVGVGGVTVPEDYKKYMNAGADAVLSATGAMWNPLLAQEIKTSL